MTVTDARIIEYQDELLVEVVGRDDRGDIDVVSYQFDYAEGDGGLRPKGSIAEPHRDMVRDALEEGGYPLESVQA